MLVSIGTAPYPPASFIFDPNFEEVLLIFVAIQCIFLEDLIHSLQSERFSPVFTICMSLRGP